MKTILIIDDFKTDALKIQESLSNIQNDVKFKLKYTAKLQEGIRYLQTNMVDLILLDLEFTKENVTAASVLGKFPNELPIIIVSNLVHFQKPLNLKANVKGFIPKSELHLLPACVLEILIPSHSSEHNIKTLIFPPRNQYQLAEGIRIEDIRFIDFYDRNVYQIHLTNGSSKEIVSLPFKHICKLIESQNITCLQQISRNEIINTNYISSISKLTNGRIEITLVNLPSRKFYVGRKHKEQFDLFF